MDPEMSGLGSLLAKDKDIKIIFIQNNLLVSSPMSLTELSKPYLNTRLEITLSRLFLISLISILSFLKGREVEVNFINFH